MKRAIDLEQNITLAVLNEKLNNLDIKLENFCKQNTSDHLEIKAKVDKTNGSVAKIQAWRLYITGALGVILFILTLFIVPLAIEWTKQVLFR